MTQQVEEQIRDLKPNFTWESLHDELAEDGYYPRPEKRGEKVKIRREEVYYITYLPTYLPPY